MCSTVKFGEELQLVSHVTSYTYRSETMTISGKKITKIFVIKTFFTFFYSCHVFKMFLTLFCFVNVFLFKKTFIENSIKKFEKHF